MLSAAAPDVHVGDLLAGKYRVERLLGVGGMGVVVAARHVDLHELRAIKLLHADVGNRPEAVERFLREARAAVRLKSEHVAKVHDIGRLETGAPYMVIEYLEGRDLGALLREQGTLPLSEAAAYVLQACEAIGEAHAAGIVHRDLKPANLFLATSADGTPCTKVLDFGFSKLTPQPGVAPGLDMTKTSMLLGSPLYMSPEQMQSTRSVDLRTDIWALGAILYELTTGRPPFEGETITQLCARVLQEPVIAPSLRSAGLPIEFDRVVLRCLEKQEASRYQSVAELAEDLATFVPEELRISVNRIFRILGVVPRRASAPPLISSSPPRPGGGTVAQWGGTSDGATQRRSTVAIVMTAVAATALLGLGATFALTRRAEPPIQPVASALPASAVADSPVVEPIVEPSAPIASASASATASADSPRIKPRLITSTKPVEPPPPPAPSASFTPSDPFGHGRK